MKTELTNYLNTETNKLKVEQQIEILFEAIVQYIVSIKQTKPI